MSSAKGIINEQHKGDHKMMTSTKGIIKINNEQHKGNHKINEQHKLKRIKEQHKGNWFH